MAVTDDIGFVPDAQASQDDLGFVPLNQEHEDLGFVPVKPTDESIAKQTKMLAIADTVARGGQPFDPDEFRAQFPDLAAARDYANATDLNQPSSIDASLAKTPLGAFGLELYHGLPSFGHRGGALALATMSDAAARAHNVLTDGNELPVDSLKSFAENPAQPLPAQIGAEEMQGLPRFGQKVLQGGITIAPSLGATSALTGFGVPAALSAALPFMFDANGKPDPVNGGMMLALPGIGKLGEAGVAKFLDSTLGFDLPEKIAKSLYDATGKTVAEDTVRRYLLAGGNQAAANAALLLQQSPEILNAPDRQQAFLDALAGNIGPGLLAFAGHPAEASGADAEAIQNLRVKGSAGELTDYTQQGKPAFVLAPTAAKLAGQVNEFGGEPVQPATSTAGAGARPPEAVTAVTDAPLQSGLTGAPVQRVNADAIATRPDLMQFKRMDQAETGINEADKLAGAWDDLKAGNLLLWEPKDPAQYGLAPGEKYIVANGHHRFEFGDRQDVPAYNAQVVREADGVSAQEARSLAAEINMADGKGTIYDQTKFLRNERDAYGADAALARAEQIGVKGRQAATIAFQAGPDLYDSFVNERISPDQAEAIAKATNLAGGDQAFEEGLQRQGIKDALAGNSPQSLNNLLQAYRVMSRGPTAEQFDLFGGNDAALKQATELAAAATRVQNELSREIRATEAAAKNAVTAKVKGIQFDRPPEEILAENEQLKAQRAAWQNFGLHPELIAQAKGYAEMHRAQKGQRGKVDKITTAVEAPKTVPTANPEAERARAAYHIHDMVGKVNGAVDKFKAALDAEKAIKEIRAMDEEKLIGEFGKPEEDAAWQEANAQDDFDKAYEIAKAVRMRQEGFHAEDAAYASQFAADLKRIKAEFEQNSHGDIDYSAQIKPSNSVKDSESTYITATVEDADRIYHDLSDWRVARHANHDRSDLGYAEDLPEEILKGAAEYGASGTPLKPETGSSISPGKPGKIESRMVGSKDITSPPANDVKSLDEKLQSLKFNTNGQLHAFGLLPAVWNTIVDGVRLAVRGGMKLSQAIDAVIGKFKEQNPGVTFDELGARAHLNAIVPTEGEGLRQFGQTVLQSDDIGDATKEAVQLYKYPIETNEQQLAEANRIIAAHGVDGAMQLITNPRVLIPESVRNVLSGRVIEEYGKEALLARSKGDKAAEEIAISKQAEAIDARLKTGTATAQGLQAMSVYGQATPDGIVRHAQKEFGDAADQEFGKQKPASDLVKQKFDQANAEALQGTINDPAVNAHAKAAVNEAVMNSPEVRKGIIVEITGALAESPEIVKQARAALGGGELNRILQRRGLSLANTSKAELDGIIGDLGKRAADIAASHYQGAEPTVTLADKLKQRLGLSDEASKRLAKSLDLEFEKMVKEARAKLPQRVAAQRAKQTFDPYDISQSGVDGEIRRQLKERNIQLGKLVQQHAATQDAAGRSIGDRVVADSGLTGNHAANLRYAFNQKFNELATAAKVRMLKTLEAQGIKIPAPLKRSAAGDIIKLTNLGAMDGSQWDDMVKRRLKLPVLTDELKRELIRRANEVQQLPKGFQRDRAATELLNYVATQKGLKWYDLASGIWYAHAVSGLMTQVHALTDNLGQLAGNILVNTIRDPLASVQMAGALKRGLIQGGLQGREILRSGIINGVTDSDRANPALELKQFTGWAYPLNAEKYFSRVLAANHVLLFRPAAEMRMLLAARDTAKSEGLSGERLNQRVADLLGNTQDRVDAARAQAVGEGLKGLDLKRRVWEILGQQQDAAMPGSAEQARQYALRATYLQDPYGIAGFVAQKMSNAFAELADKNPVAGSLAKIVVSPFMKIAGNILDEKLNWTPLGAYRAFKGSRTGELFGKPLTDQRAVGDLYAKAIMGTVATAALASLANVSGNGPASPTAKKELMETGWRPHSIKIGDQWFDYLRTPVALPLAIWANYQDALKYQKLDLEDATGRASFALAATIDTILGQSYLDTVGRLFEAAKNPNAKTGGQKLEEIAARTGSKFVVPNAVMDIDWLFDPKLYDKNGVRAMVMSQVPFVRRENKPVLNVLGDPIKSPIWDRDFSKMQPDPLWRTIAAKQAWIAPVPSTVIIGDKTGGPGAYRAMTPNELYDYTRDSGQQIRAALESQLPDLQSMEPDEAKRTVRDTVEKIRKEVRDNYAP